MSLVLPIESILWLKSPRQGGIGAIVPRLDAPLSIIESKGSPRGAGLDALVVVDIMDGT